ncbi:MAG: 2Fe-2S iron-sulfur cluster-binding protein [Christensenellales bacterium]
MEQAGIKAPSRCRSGQCGWCHSRLVSGEVFIPDEADGRREADKKFGWDTPLLHVSAQRYRAGSFHIF